MRILLILFLLAFFPRFAAANPPVFRVFLEKETMVIGDSNTLIFNLLSAEKCWPDTFFTASLDSILGKENILGTSGWKNGKNGWVYLIAFVAFDEGDIRILPMQLDYRTTNTRASIFSPEKILHVVAQKISDSTQLQPIKDIQREPTSWLDYLPLILSIAAVILGILAFFWWKFRKNSSKKQPEAELILLPFWELALEKLDFLEKKQLWQSGKTKEYHTELTEIVRAYLSKRFQMAATTQTSAQVLVAIKNHPDVSENLRSQLQKLLRTVDLVKFARAEPPDDFHQQALDQARVFIKETMPIKPEIIENQLVTPISETNLPENRALFTAAAPEKTAAIAAKYGSKNRRFAAGVIDNLVWLGGLILVARAIFWLLDELEFRDEGGFGTGFISLVCVFGLLVFTWFFHIFMEIHGLTPGKIAFGLKTVDESGAPMTDKQARRRFISKFRLESVILRGVDTDLRRQAEHDHENGTVVLIRKLS